jgi:tetratricopeptide (TPR) repeat protein
MNPPDDRTLAQAQAELVLDPASAYRWVDLADAELDANNLAAGKFCLRQALAAAPGNPAILFRAANCYLRLEDYPETLRHLTAVLRNPELAGYYDRVFTLYSQMDLPFEDLLDQGLPRTPQAANAFLQFWISQGKLDEAQETWTWINKNSLTSVPSAGSYVSLLAKQSRWDEALQSWSDYTGQLDGSYLKTNWVYNGSFERNPVECPFDWKLQPQPGLVVVRDSDVSYRGHTSLRLTYSETPKNQQPAAYQTVLLQPGQWQIKMAMKTRQVTSDQGVAIRLVDRADPSKLDVTTTSMQGTEDWTVITKRFEVKTPGRQALVEILRPPGRDFDIRLTGTVWIDAVELMPLELLKATGLTKTGHPCESHSDCGDGEVSLQTAAQDDPQK